MGNSNWSKFIEQITLAEVLPPLHNWAVFYLCKCRLHNFRPTWSNTI